MHADVDTWSQQQLGKPSLHPESFATRPAASRSNARGFPGPYGANTRREIFPCVCVCVCVCVGKYSNVCLCMGGLGKVYRRGERILTAQARRGNT